MQVVECTSGCYKIEPNADETNTIKHLAKQLNIKPETIIEWIVSYELLKYYQEISF